MVPRSSCNQRDGGDSSQHLGEQEAQEEEEKQRQSGRVVRLAKLLNRMVLMGGLEQATAEKVSMEEELLHRQPDETWRSWLAVIMFLLVLMFVGFMSLLRRERKLREEVEAIKVEFQEYQADQSMQHSWTHDYLDNLRIGVVTVGGY